MPEEKWLVEDEKTLELGAIKTLKVSLISGQVDIIGHDEPTTKVEVHSVRGKSLLIVVTDDHLEIDHPQLNWDNFIDVFKSFRGSASADVSILVPRPVALKLGVVNSNALVSGLHHSASVSTVSGPIVVDSVIGDVQLNAVSGEISVRNHDGAISAKTVSGEIMASGELTSFKGDSVSGNMFLDVSGTPDSIVTKSVSGSVTARLAEGTPAQYTVNTVSGKIQLDDSEISGLHGTYSTKFGSLDKSWLDLRANSVSGSVSVLHAVSS